MPNWCNNHATIYGSKEEIKKIADIIDANADGNLFEPLVGRLDNWGCKWDVRMSEADVQFYDEEIALFFDTAWSPPLDFYEELAKKYGVSIEADYNEPGCDFAGSASIDKEGNIDNREYKYLEGLYHRGDDYFWDEVRSQLDDMIEEYDEPTHEDVAEWLHFMTDAELYDLIKEYEDKLAK